MQNLSLDAAALAVESSLVGAGMKPGISVEEERSVGSQSPQDDDNASNTSIHHPTLTLTRDQMPTKNFSSRHY